MVDTYTLTPEYCPILACSALFQTRSMLQEITEQNDRLETVNRDLNASRNDWKVLAEIKSARVEELERANKSYKQANLEAWSDIQRLIEDNKNLRRRMGEIK